MSATTAFGKTVLAAYLIAARVVSTLILVHRQQLMEQWVERLGTFLDLPAEVPLPIDPAWKNDYAASVRRLIRDGVDAPLAGLFVVATQPNSDEQRARSAAEAFLFQRLESLTETTGLFRLNAKLPIPFDNWSEMEIDLYSADLKLAIEIDGPQHLSDPAAYRRDRRKDALLQENGCHILRFLAEDLSKQLDATLDAIHRAIAHLRRKQPHP